MNNPLTPVQALQRRIIALHGLRDTASNIDGLVDDLIAALELAKADAEYMEHLKLEPKCSGSHWDYWLAEKGFMRTITAAARAKLYEALQR